MAEGELAWTSFNIPVRIVENTWNGFIRSEPRYGAHPHEKPTGLYRWQLSEYLKKHIQSEWKILDTHLGSGSSRIAAYDMGFDFTGFEIDKDYFEAQEKRFRQHTAQTKLFQPQPA
jgi:site-specific DNA-methyltransferase (adenine-specific)